MRSSSLLCLVFLFAIWILEVSSQHDDYDDDDDGATGPADIVAVEQEMTALEKDYDDDDDGATGPADIVAVEQEMTALEKELRKGKRKFNELWRSIKSRAQDDEAIPYRDPTMRTLRTETRKIRRSLSRGLRSLNDFMTCLNSCLKAHTDDDYTASEANIRYFCNHSCLMVFEVPSSSSPSVSAYHMEDHKPITAGNGLVG